MRSSRSPQQQVVQDPTNRGIVAANNVCAGKLKQGLSHCEPNSFWICFGRPRCAGGKKGGAGRPHKLLIHAL
eukprot:scaffold150670_cov16-Tisochrysis_lutea.AAC.2